jgi:hypothetical protein
MLVTFRSALQSMKRIEQIGRENRMLRAGYFQATKDADFWCSQADPNFPYMQQHMSARMANDGETRTFATDRIRQGVHDKGSGEYADIDSPFDKRPFRAVEWPKISATDTRHITAFRLPHDPTSWYRNHVQCNLPSGAYLAPEMGLCSECFARVPRDSITGQVGIIPSCNNYKTTDGKTYNVPCGSTSFVPMAFIDYDSWEECYVWDVQRFFGSDPNYDMYKIGGPGAVNPCINPVPEDLWRRVGRKAGWQPWHVVGDYAIVSNCEGKRAVSNAALDAVADTRSIATWKVFEQLGIFGLYGYTTPGEIPLVQVSSENETTQVIADAIAGQSNAQNFRRGEIPWMLGTNPTTLTTRCIPSSASPSATGNRTNLYAAFPTYLNASREPGCVGAPSPLAIDLGVIAGRNPSSGIRTRAIAGQKLSGDNDIEYNANQYMKLGSISMFRHAQAMGLCYPSAPTRVTLSSDWDYTALNWDVLQPLQPINFNYSEIITSLGDWQTAQNEHIFLSEILQPLSDSMVRIASSEQWRVIRDTKTHQTWHLPRHYQDDPLAPALRANSGLDLGLATNIYRYRFNGVDHAWCQIVVIDSEGKPRQGLHFKTLSTNYRGARGYWGKKGVIEDNFGNSMRIGDSFAQ